MTITLEPMVEAKLLEKAQREGQDPHALVNDVLSDYLAKDSPLSTDDIRAALESKHVKPIEQLIAEQRTKHSYSSSWPSQNSVQEIAPGEFVNTIEND